MAACSEFGLGVHGSRHDLLAQLVARVVGVSVRAATHRSRPARVASPHSWIASPRPTA